MLDLFIVLCSHKDCKFASTILVDEEQALACRDGHNSDTYYAEDEKHEAYILTLVARKYAR